MRIVAGRHKGRALKAPIGRAVRPTADRARQAVFDMLAHHDWGHGSGSASVVADARVLDVFAGTGAFGLEALSRGAAHASFIERDPQACDVIRANIAALGENARATVYRADATRVPTAPRDGREAPCALAFLDPPYGSGLGQVALAALSDAGWLAARAMCVLETQSREKITVPTGFIEIEQRRYGRAQFLFLQAPTELVR